MKASEWAFDRTKEAFKQVAQDEEEKVSSVQEIMFKSTDCLRRIIAPVGGQGGVTMSYPCPICNSFPLGDYVWWVSGENIQIGGAQFVERSTIGTNQTGSVYQAKVFTAHAVPQGLRANLINALKLLAN